MMPLLLALGARVQDLSQMREPIAEDDDARADFVASIAAVAWRRRRAAVLHYVRERFPDYRPSRCNSDSGSSIASIAAADEVEGSAKAEPAAVAGGPGDPAGAGMPAIEPGDG